MERKTHSAAGVSYSQNDQIIQKRIMIIVGAIVIPPVVVILALYILICDIGCWWGIRSRLQQD